VSGVNFIRSRYSAIDLALVATVLVEGTIDIGRYRYGLVS
jgi:hypothetical protein